MNTVRIWFEKKGTARFISHLDLNRCFSRALHKAKIPLWYTQGFNPHAFLTFALPLSLGITGVRESMDIKMEEELPEAELIERLNSALPEDIRVYRVTEPVMKPGKIAFAAFEILLEPETLSVQQLQKGIEELFALPELIVPKRFKTGIREIDLKPALSNIKLSVEGEKVRLSAILPAGSNENINPNLIVTTIENRLECSLYADITRTNLFDASMQVFA